MQQFQEKMPVKRTKQRLSYNEEQMLNNRHKKNKRNNRTDKRQMLEL